MSESHQQRQRKANNCTHKRQRQALLNIFLFISIHYLTPSQPPAPCLPPHCLSVSERIHRKQSPFVIFALFTQPVHLAQW